MGPNLEQRNKEFNTETLASVIFQKWSTQKAFVWSSVEWKWVASDRKRGRGREREREKGGGGMEEKESFKKEAR